MLASALRHDCSKAVEVFKSVIVILDDVLNCLFQFAAEQPAHTMMPVDIGGHNAAEGLPRQLFASLLCACARSY